MALLMLTALSFGIGWLARGSTLTTGGDDATYLSLSRSLGDGAYRENFLPGAPAHAQYPPGMPAWLFAVRTVAGGSLDAGIAANLLLLALAAGLLADAMRRLGRPWLGIVAAALILLNPQLLTIATQLRSETLYLALCSIALWASLVATDSPRVGWVTLAVVVALAAFLTRSAGIAIIPAVLLPLAARRHWRGIVLAGFGSAMVVVGWFAYTAWAGRQTLGHTYAADLAARPPARDLLTAVGPAFVNAKFYFVRLASNSFSIPDIPDHAADNGILGLLLLVAIAVGMIQLASRWVAVPTFLLLSLGVLLVFPWPFMRFLHVLQPWLVVTLLLGVSSLARRVGSRRGEALAITIGVVLASFGFARQLGAVKQMQGCHAAAAIRDARCYDLEARHFYAAAEALRDSIPADAIVAASKPALVYELSGRVSFPLQEFTHRSVDSLLAPHGPVAYILLTRLLPFETESVASRLRATCTSLTLYREFNPGTLIVTRRIAGDVRPSACTALDRYLADTAPNYDLDPR